MTFGQPLWFWAFALLPVLLLIFIQNERRRTKLLRQLVAARLQDRLAGTVSVGRRRFRFFLVLLALACLIASLAQPRLGSTMEQSKRKGRDVIIAIDCSRSMLATDLAPSRLGRAKLAAQDFIGQLQGDRIGLIAFAGSAFLQAPLTIDYGAVLSSLNELDTTIIPRGGTNIAGAIKEAVEAFGKGESENRCLLIFTDGEELDADGIAAAAAQKDKIKIFTVGLGSPDGSLIPVPGEDGGTAFVKDDRGEMVKSRLDEDRLTKIAEATGGFYVHLLNGPAEMQQIVRTGLGQMKEQDIDARMSRRPIERYQWPLSAGLALLVISTLISERKRPVRRKLAIALVLGLGLFGGSSVQAQWNNPGVQQYRSGVGASEKWVELKNKKEDAEAADKERQTARQEFEKAYQSFAEQLRRRPNSPELNFNLGAAAYKLERDDEALLAFSKATLSDDPKLRVDAESNLANTLYQKGRKKKETDRSGTLVDWKDGLKHYDDALKVQPENKLVQGYREFLRQEIEKLEKEPPKSDQQKQDEKKEKQDQQKDQEQSKDGKKDQEQQQEQKKDQQSQKAEGGDPKDGSAPEKDQQAKNQDQKDGEKKPDQQPKPEKGDEKKDAKEDPSGAGQNGSPQKDGKKQDQPAPSPDQPEKKPAGEIKGQDGNPTPADPQQEAAMEEQAAAEGKMTEAQAKSLLESLKGEDDRVLLKPAERPRGRAFRDW